MWSNSRPKANVVMNVNLYFLNVCSWEKAMTERSVWAKKCNVPWKFSVLFKSFTIFCLLKSYKQMEQMQTQKFQNDIAQCSEKG